jgi:hypothetical protein
MPSLCVWVAFRLAALPACAQKRGSFEKVWPMGDVISIAFGVVIFALLIFYVPACEKV